jgi:WhiB family transcriptional regulator, redox-sensing transcriptional regulator
MTPGTMSTGTMSAGTARAGNWRDAGACLHADPDLFFPVSATGPSRKEVAQAKAFCAHCPVRRQCLEFAQDNGVYGIWGGTTMLERQRIRRRDQRAARARARDAG